MRQISLNEKLVVYFVILGITGVIIVQAFSYYHARNALLDRTFDQLISVRVQKKNQVEDFLKDRLKEASLIAQHQETETIRNFLAHTTENSHREIMISSLIAPYQLAHLSSTGYYKNLYIIAGSGLGIRIKPDSAFSPSVILTDVSKILIPPAILSDSFHQHGAVIHDIRESNNSLPSIFISAQVAGTADMVVVLEISVSEINRIMLENKPRNGLGESGECYLVGKDHLMRSQSRFQDLSILKTKVTTPGVVNALEHQTGTAIFDDYRGINVLSSYGPVDIAGLRWVILAEIDTSEAMAPVYNLLKNVLLIGISIALLIFVFTYILSRKITAPLVSLNKAANDIGSGGLDIHLPVSSNDEIGELTQTFNRMALQLKEQQLALTEERKKRLVSMIDGQEQERQRLSRDLHDGLGQSFIAIKLQLENFCQTLDPGRNAKMEKIKVYFNQIIEEIRRLSNDLSPSGLEEFGLVTALRNLCRTFGEQSHVDIRFLSLGNVLDPGRQKRIYLYRICQEALNNAVKHSGSEKIEVRLSFEDSTIRLCIQDFGVGFDPKLTGKGHGNGLHNINDRAQLLNGKITINSNPGKGTVLSFECMA